MLNSNPIYKNTISYNQRALISNLALAGTELNFSIQNLQCLNKIVEGSDVEPNYLSPAHFFFASELHQVLTAISNSLRLYDISSTVEELSTLPTESLLSYPNVYRSLGNLINETKYGGLTFSSIFSVKNGLPLKRGVISEYESIKSWLHDNILTKSAYVNYIALTYYDDLSYIINDYSAYMEAVEANLTTLSNCIKEDDHLKAVNIIKSELGIQGW